MALSSSPVVYPPSSAPAPAPILKKKRKLFQTFPTHDTTTKKCRSTGDQIVSNEETRPDFDEGTTYGGRTIPINHTDGTATTNTDRGTHLEPDQPSDTFPSDSLESVLNRIRSGTITEGNEGIQLRSSSGAAFRVPLRKKTATQSYERIIAERSTTANGRAQKAYYGIEIHALMKEANVQRELREAAREVQAQKELIQSIEQPMPLLQASKNASRSHQMWTEKYRARKFTDLVGDERTHRSVLHWLKAWDSIVFPGSVKNKPKRIYEDKDDDRRHKKILLLTGPPGLGKTTLAHVCAKQAGYGVLEINASDDRSRDVVKGRIKDALGTQTVRGIQEQGQALRAGRPVCIVVDEVDGVVSGSNASGGEGGFMKALIDLVHLDQQNSSHAVSSTTHKTGKKKGDRFRLLRPLILICNDVYAPSLRPLRNSGLAEIVHVRRPPLEKVIARMKIIFDRERIACDQDAIRRLCESSWGLANRKQTSTGLRGAGDGDIRTVLVQSEWLAHNLRSTSSTQARLTRKWFEEQLGDSHSRGSQKGLGRGGVREIVERVFVEGAGLPNLPTSLSADENRMVKESKLATLGVADLRKRSAMNALREMIDASGEHDRLMTDCFATYPTQIYQDDVFLSKPDAGYDWLHFHDSLSTRVYGGQEWELNPYFSSSACGFHHLFSAVQRTASHWNSDDRKQGGVEDEKDIHPFSGPKADFAANEALKQNYTVLTELQSNFSAGLLRLFSSTDDIALDLVPNLGRILSPDVKPVVVGGVNSVASVRKESERRCVNNAVRVMHAVGIQFEKVRIEHEGFGSHVSGGFVLRMEPPIDTLNTFHTSSTSSSKGSLSSSTSTSTAPVRYAVRQVLDQELQKEKKLQTSLARQARLDIDSSTHSSVNSVSHLHGQRDSESISAGRDGDKENEKENVLGSSDVTKVTAKTVVKRDFFGRPIAPTTTGLNVEELNKAQKLAGNKQSKMIGTITSGKAATGRTWVSFHEGFSNAVRKPITLKDLMDGF